MPRQPLGPGELLLGDAPPGPSATRGVDLLVIETRYQGGQRHPKGPREAGQDVQSGVPQSPLNPADVGPVQVRRLGKLLLRQSSALAQRAHAVSEGAA